MLSFDKMEGPRVAALQSKREWKILIGIGGSFNPPHVCHVEMLKHARHVLQTLTQCDVLWGCFAAATDSHVQAKTDMAMKGKLLFSCLSFSLSLSL